MFASLCFAAGLLLAPAQEILSGQTPPAAAMDQIAEKAKASSCPCAKAPPASSQPLAPFSEASSPSAKTLPEATGTSRDPKHLGGSSGNIQRVSTPPASDQVKLIDIEKNIINYTNQQRAQHGLPPLKVCPKLMASARRHAAWMTRHRILRHTTDPVAENIAMGQRTSWEVVQDWMRSSGHRANILNPHYRWIGAAAYRTPEGTIYWCQQFRP